MRATPARHLADRLDVSIATDHPCLPGHFPGHPIVPGVVILDRVLDAIEAAHGPLGPVRLPQVKFLKPLLPGDRARVEIEAIASADAVVAPTRWRFRVLRDAELLASGELVSTANVDDGLVAAPGAGPAG